MRQRNSSRASNLPSSTMERPATRKEAHTDHVRPTRTISPAFRSGPRQKRHDPSADEIIRFVREFQRGDFQHQGPAGLVRKSVLPAIGGHNTSDSFNTGINMNELTNVNNTEPNLTSRGANSINNHHKISTEADLGITNESSEFPENEDFVRDFNGEQFHISAEVLNKEQLTDLNNENSFLVNGNVMDYQGQETARTLNQKSITAEKLLANSGWKQTLKYEGPVNGSTSHYLSQPAQTTPRFLNGTSKAGQLLRPRALPQLPPLMRGAAPTRPSAPSPSLTPPSPRSMDSGDEDSFEDDLELGDRMNIENANLV